MFGAMFSGIPQLRRKNPLIRPGEYRTVGGRRGGIVVLAGDVEG